MSSRRSRSTSSGQAPVARDPATPQEWQEAVNAACVMRNVADCMMYGLLTGPAINVARCDDLLIRGAAIGIHPEPRLARSSLERLILSVAKQSAEHKSQITNHKLPIPHSAGGRP